VAVVLAQHQAVLAAGVGCDVLRLHPDRCTAVLLLVDGEGHARRRCDRRADWRSDRRSGGVLQRPAVTNEIGNGCG